MTEIRGVIRWENPPPSIHKARRSSAGVRRVDRYAEAADQLRSKPNTWAVVTESAANGVAAGVATSIARGLYPSWEPAGSFEAVTRKRNGVTALYARYVGDEPPA